MANKGHVEILEKGIKTWNRWRAKNVQLKPDLSRIMFRWRSLVRANLTETNLRGSNLTNSNLSRANLRGADLSGANLQRANLSEADLREANLNGANLNGANVTRANLRRVAFTAQGKPRGSASFLDLATCIGLETATFSEADFLRDYLTRAFECAHRPDAYEVKNWPKFVQLAIHNIRGLLALYSDHRPPNQLIEVAYTITAELLKYLKKHPKALYEIKPRQFEELIAEILASYKWEVQLTPPIRDGGYDIFAISKDIKPGVQSSWVIECKKYGPENKLGVDIVRALYGIKSDLKVANALLATTSYFTKGAKAFKASRYDIELKDYRDIVQWINQYRPNPNGKLYIKDNKLILPNED